MSPARETVAPNGRRLTLTNHAAYDLVMAVATGELDSVDGIAAVLRQPPVQPASRYGSTL